MLLKKLREAEEKEREYVFPSPKRNNIKPFKSISFWPFPTSIIHIQIYFY